MRIELCESEGYLVVVADPAALLRLTMLACLPVLVAALHAPSLRLPTTAAARAPAAVCSLAESLRSTLSEVRAASPLSAGEAAEVLPQVLTPQVLIGKAEEVGEAAS